MKNIRILNVLQNDVQNIQIALLDMAFILKLCLVIRFWRILESSRVKYIFYFIFKKN